MNKLQLKLYKLIKEEIDRIKLIKDNKIFYLNGVLWISSGMGSGSTTQFHKIQKYLTNDRKDMNYDSNLNQIVEWAIG